MAEVNGIPTINDYIALREACEMSTGYRGRGLPPLTKVFPAGTRVQYTTFPYSGKYAARAGGEPITHWVHTVSVHEGHYTYTCSKSRSVAP